MCAHALSRPAHGVAYGVIPLMAGIPIGSMDAHGDETHCMDGDMHDGLLL